MFVEIHMLQNFAPSCLNRDDTNSAKDCMFGGARRARISSQCAKRAMREWMQNASALEGHMGVRTKRLHDTLVKRFIEDGENSEDAAKVVEYTIVLMGLKFQKAKKDETERLSQYVLFLGEDEIAALKKQVSAHWDVLVEAAGKKKRPAKKDLPPEFSKALGCVLDGKRAADVALFGRMLADLPDKNIDAACQVAHAISTHRVEMEMDFFTAVDDLQPEDTSGAEMMGTVEFNSACFYRYVVIYWRKLVENLGNDQDLARRTVETFMRASVEAIPSGKQNTFAAHNPPSLVFGLVRNEGAPWSLANAFESPVRASGKGIVDASMLRLNEYYGALKKMYGGEPSEAVWTALEQSENLGKLGCREDSIEGFIQAIMKALPGAGS